MQTIFRIALLFLTVFIGSVAHGQSFPTKSISMVVPYPAGGPYDTTLRNLAEILRRKLSQPIVIEARPGGASLIATRSVQLAPADGHTLLFQTGLLSLNTLVYKDAGYTMDDFVPLAAVATQPYVLYVNAKMPASNLSELLAYVKKNESRMNVGDFGNVGTVQLLIDQINEAGKMKITQIPYKGAGEMTAALLADNIQLMFAAVGPGKPLIETGKLKGIAIANDVRSPSLPNVPTFAELGYPSVNSISFLAFFVRKETPPAILEQLRKVINEAVATPEFKERIMPMGIEPWIASTSKLTEFVAKDFETWKQRAASSK